MFEQRDRHKVFELHFLARALPLSCAGDSSNLSRCRKSSCWRDPEKERNMSYCSRTFRNRTVRLRSADQRYKRRQKLHKQSLTGFGSQTKYIADLSRARLRYGLYGVLSRLLKNSRWIEPEREKRTCTSIHRFWEEARERETNKHKVTNNPPKYKPVLSSRGDKQSTAYMSERVQREKQTSDIDM